MAAEDAPGDLRPNITTIDKSVAVLTVKFDQMTRSVESMERKLDSALAMFATKEELKTTNERINKIEGQIGWGVKSVLGIVLAAVIGGVLIIGKH